jgi:S1-C subfamily serine protease
VTRRQVVVPLLAAVLGSGLTVAAMVAGGRSSTGPLARERGVMALGSPGALDANEIYDRASAGVVYISAQTVQPGAGAFKTDAGSELSLSTGSGFVLDGDGRVVTNAHVVNGVTGIQVTFPDGQIVPARVIGKDQETDLAVLAVDPDGLDLRPLELGDSSRVRPGDQVIAIANSNGSQPTAGTGRIAAAGQRIEAPGGFIVDGLLQTDAVIQPATSGGPLLGADGRVVAVSTQLTDGDGAASYAIPINSVRGVLTQLTEDHKVIRPYLGLQGRTAAGGVEVVQVFASGPADRAGLHTGDMIETIDGHPAHTLVDLLAEVGRHQPGQSVRLHVLRDGSQGDVDLRLDERPATVPGS